MFGNLITNKQLVDLINDKVVSIVPFHAEDMSLAHLTLHTNKIFRKQPNGSLQLVHNFEANKNPYQLAPNEYIVVEIKEKITLHKDSIVGHFIPASNLIEDGIGLTAGKIDKKYGTTIDHNLEMIRFGVKNMTEYTFVLTPLYRIAHMILFDFRGVALEKIELSEEEKRIRLQRLVKSYDDGPLYYEED